MIKVLMILALAGQPVPLIGENQQESFSTMALCTEALPRLDAEAETFFKENGKTRGEDYQFELKCVETPNQDNKI